ncbi:MAG: hypothetical protein CMD98_06815 [Gammaproteobacteria bacterium]|nr:hypothetical protein [Gammaproteobacteria bacterium]|tara:strand:+ start:34944 stop:35285 length:342 start_codon:yes stop_codon:yes gene_type:complete
MSEPQLDLRETAGVRLDVKTLVGIIAMILSIAGVYFSLQGQIAQLQLDVIRLQDQQAMNTEFRIKWPRGELGALPDDAVQDINIEYLKESVDDLIDELDEVSKEIEDHIRERE